VPFDLAGPNGFFEHLRRRLEKKDHAVVVVAEGAKPKGGSVSVISKEVGQAERLGGVGEKVAEALAAAEASALVGG
jgi:6-phosphofructokinase 1